MGLKFVQLLNFIENKHFESLKIIFEASGKCISLYSHRFTYVTLEYLREADERTKNQRKLVSHSTTFPYNRTLFPTHFSHDFSSHYSVVWRLLPLVPQNKNCGRSARSTTCNCNYIFSTSITSKRITSSSRCTWEMNLKKKMDKFPGGQSE